MREKGSRIADDGRGGLLVGETEQREDEVFVASSYV